MDRFWSKVDRTDDDDDCWNWQAGTYHGREYGKFWFQSRAERAHRVAYELDTGEEPGDDCVLHKCDNPRCVNPTHLYLGNQSDNLQDAYDRDRRPEPTWLKGEAKEEAKLTEDEIREIRRRYEEDDEMTYKRLSNDYDVTLSNISLIVQRRTWKHVED